MPGMEMYSRDDIEKMRQEMEGKMDEDESRKNDGHSLNGSGEDVGFVQTVVDAFKRFWKWLQSLFGLVKYKSDEL